MALEELLGAVVPFKRDVYARVRWAMQCVCGKGGGEGRERWCGGRWWGRRWRGGRWQGGRHGTCIREPVTLALSHRTQPPPPLPQVAEEFAPRIKHLLASGQLGGPRAPN